MAERLGWVGFAEAARDAPVGWAARGSEESAAVRQAGARGCVPFAGRPVNCQRVAGAPSPPTWELAAIKFRYQLQIFETCSTPGATAGAFAVEHSKACGV